MVSIRRITPFRIGLTTLASLRRKRDRPPSSSIVQDFLSHRRPFPENSAIFGCFGAARPARRSTGTRGIGSNPRRTAGGGPVRDEEYLEFLVIFASPPRGSMDESGTIGHRTRRGTRRPGNPCRVAGAAVGPSPPGDARSGREVRRSLASRRLASGPKAPSTLPRSRRPDPEKPQESRSGFTLFLFSVPGCRIKMSKHFD